MRRAVLAVTTAFLMTASVAYSQHEDAPDRKAPAVVDSNALHVVVDPGHGGGNSGAPSHVDGAFERTLTLSLSRELARQLETRGVRVTMTRDADAFLTLRQRSDIANAAGADIFVSIHANASPDHSRLGYETYVLSPGALDVDARALRTDTTSGSRPGVSRALNRMLDDVERGLAQPRAADIASAIQEQLATARPDSANRGVKQDSMHVLLGARMPAVLVEVGFLDHPVEGPQLQDPATQTRIAAAIASAITTRERP